MSAPEALAANAGAPGVTIGACRLDVTELAAYRERAADLHAVVRDHGLRLPSTGGVASTADALVLSVRPDRWLVLAAPASAGAAAATWCQRCDGRAAVIDQSSALAAIFLSGPAAREALARGCRLDLSVDAFPPGRAAATVIAQVAATLAVLRGGVLLLTPSTTARHVREWLETSARAFGVGSPAPLAFSTLLGHHDS